MLKKEIRSHLLVTLFWLVLVTLLRWRWEGNLILLWLGGLTGTFLIDIDHLLYVFIYPQELTSMRVKQLLDQHQFKAALVLLVDTHEERHRLVLHSALFQIILLVACFFVLTSTGSLFGAGLVMAMALHLLKDDFGLLLAGRGDWLQQILFWQFKVKLSPLQLKFFVLLMFLFFFGLNFFLI